MIEVEEAQEAQEDEYDAERMRSVLSVGLFRLHKLRRGLHCWLALNSPVPWKLCTRKGQINNATSDVQTFHLILLRLLKALDLPA
jgi:hypothetical protein